jgi:hypothetical protein
MSALDLAFRFGRRPARVVMTKKRLGGLSSP